MPLQYHEGNNLPCEESFENPEYIMEHVKNTIATIQNTSRNILKIL